MPTSFLNLPYELREQVYSYMMPPSPEGKEFFRPASGLTALSTGTHGTPCGYLLSVNDQITDEILDNKDPHFDQLERSCHLRRLRRLQIVLWTGVIDDWTLAVLLPKARRLCDVLSNAHALVEISVCAPLSKWKEDSKKMELVRIFQAKFPALVITETLIIGGNKIDLKDWSNTVQFEIPFVCNCRK